MYTPPTMQGKTSSSAYAKLRLQWKRKLQSQFACPSAVKRYSLFKRTKPDVVDVKNLQILNDIVSESFQMIRNTSYRFRMPIVHENMCFNSREVDRKQVWHKVDEA